MSPFRLTPLSSTPKLLRAPLSLSLSHPISILSTPPHPFPAPRHASSHPSLHPPFHRPHSPLHHPPQHYPLQHPQRRHKSRQTRLARKSGMSSMQTSKVEDDIGLIPHLYVRPPSHDLPPWLNRRTWWKRVRLEWVWVKTRCQNYAS